MISHNSFIQTNSRSIIWLFLIVILFLSIAVRTYMLFYHFTNCDDIGVAITTLHFDNFFKRFFAFLSWTYAPLQFLFEAPLISMAYSYESIIVLGRLPSFLLSILNILLCHYLLSSVFKNRLYVLLGDVWIALSWENIIYGAQMEPYAIGVTFVFLHLIIMKEWDNYKSYNKKLFRLTTVLMILSCYAQYQLFMFVFAAYFALFIGELRNRNDHNIKRVVLSGGFVVFSCLPLIYLLLNSNLLNRGVNFWNVGKNNEFLFSESMNDGIIGYFYHSIEFFFSNYYCIIKYYFASDVNVVSDIISIVVILTSLFGLFEINRNICRKFVRLAVYIDAVLVLNVILVINGSLVFGPSRHNLVLFPIILFLSIYGLAIICEKFVTRRRWVDCFICCILALEVLSFCWVLHDELIYRTNRMSERYMNELVRNYRPDAILGHGRLLYDYHLLQIEEYTQLSSYIRYGLLNKETKYNKTGRIIFISDRRLSKSDFNEIMDLIMKDYGKKWEFQNCTWEKLSLIYSDEFVTDRQVDYASKYYANCYNGQCAYVFKYD